MLYLIPVVNVFAPFILGACGNRWAWQAGLYGDRIEFLQVQQRWALGGLVGLCLLLWASGPWAPLPPSATAVALGTLVIWVLPPWAHWIEKHSGAAGGRTGGGGGAA